jgi:hypothetical protein
MIMHALADLCHSFGDELSEKRHSMTEGFAVGNAVTD